MTLIDTNILLDILTADSSWMDWSITNMRNRASLGPLIINDVVYAELAGHVSSASELDDHVATLDVRIAPMPKAALF